MNANERAKVVAEIVEAIRPLLAPVSLLRMRDVCARVGLSDAFVYELIAKGKFPEAAVRLGANGTGVRWDSRDIDHWITSKLSTPTASPSAPSARPVHSVAGASSRKAS